MSFSIYKPFKYINYNNNIFHANQYSNQILLFFFLSSSLSLLLFFFLFRSTLTITKQNQEYCRFPKLEECAHFHYERVQLGKINLTLIEDKFDPHITNVSQEASGNSPNLQQLWFIIRVTAEKCEPFLIRRSFENMKMLDEMLHRCCYDRKISNLADLSDLELDGDDIEMDTNVSKYLDRFSSIVSDSLTCGQILSW